MIHKEKGGLSDARNAGLKIASGKYIGFVDSDDWISSEMYQMLYEKMIGTKSDISICGVQMVWEDGRTQNLTKNGEAVLDNAQAMRALVEESWIKQPVWNKLYKRSVIEKIPFEKGKYHEDVFWSYQPIARSERVSIFDTICYFYRQRSDSIMSKKFSKKRLDALDAYEMRLDFLEKNYPQLAEYARKRAYFFTVYLMQSALKENADPELIKEIEEKSRCFFPHRGLSLKERLWRFFLYISFQGTCKLRNYFKIGI